MKSKRAINQKRKTKMIKMKALVETANRKTETKIGRIWLTTSELAFNLPIKVNCTSFVDN